MGCELLRGQGFPKSIKTSGRVVAARDPDFSDPDHNTVCDVPVACRWADGCFFFAGFCRSCFWFLWEAIEFGGSSSKLKFEL